MLAFDEQEAETILDNLCQLYKEHRQSCGTQLSILNRKPLATLLTNVRKVAISRGQSTTLGKIIRKIAHRIVEQILRERAELKKVGAKSGDTKNRAQVRISFIPLAKKMFDPIPPNKVPSLYLALFNCIPKYMSAHGVQLFENGNSGNICFSIEELLMNVIIPYQLPHSVKAPCPQSAEGTSNIKKNSKGVHYIQAPARVRLEIEHSIQLIRHFLPIKLPFESKIWKQIRYILVPSNSKDKLRQLLPEITAAYKKGTISFAALTFAMRDDVLSEFAEEPDAILHALYLGPLGAPTVEAFASGRSEEFRQKCRAILGEAEIAMRTPEDFAVRKPPRISYDNPELRGYSDFRRNAQVLMRDLKGESRADSSIPMGWACAALKKFAKKTYIDKTWKEENLYELIWTIMCQRPNLKKFICDLLEKEFHDYGAARYWRRMHPALMNRTYVRNRNELCCDPLSPTEDYLNFHNDVQTIHFVNTAADLHMVAVELDRLKNKDPLSNVVVGLDAEWSAYVANSRATILQLSLRDRIFIIDLENRSELPLSALREFFDILFLDKSILKLGFQFSEDLVQMRAAVPHCRALFEPENVVCVGKLFAELLERTEKLCNKDEILKEVLPPIVAYEEKEHPDNTEEEETESVVALQPKGAPGESVLQRTVNRGLSYVCEQVLGRPLDKTEQCSVWDRRPLRSSQLRYAAMDAYCLLLIYDVCCKWAQRLDLTIEEVLSRQEPIRVSPPLLSEQF